MDDAATGDQLIHNDEQLTQLLTQLGQQLSTVVQRSTSDIVAHFDRTIRRVAAFPPVLPSRDHGPPVRQLHKKSARFEAAQGSAQMSEAKRRSLEDKNLMQDKKYKELEIDLRKTRDNLQKVRTDIKVLNPIPIKDGTEDNVRLDEDFCTDFRELRNDILKLVHTSFQAKKISYHHHRGHPTERQSKWLSGWNHRSPELRIHRARGAIFSIVFNAFFAMPYFGVGGKLEKALRDFEIDMEESISPTDIIEWRRRTVSAVTALGRASETPKSTAAEICETLTPIISPNGRTTAFDEAIYSKILEICVKAAQISLALRQSRATFHVDVARGVEKVDVAEDSRVELVAIEGKTDSNFVRLSFTVFGGLTKATLTPGDNDEVVTLIKPDVVGYV